MPRSFGITLAALALAGAARAAEAPHPVIPAFERFYSGGKADAARGGRLLLGELNCISCHAAQDIAVKQAPILDDVGARVRAGWLRKFLADPQAVKPGTTMPKLLADDPQRDGKIEALVHFLAATGTPRPQRPDLKGVVLGLDLYHKVGCVACHGPCDGAGNAAKVNAAVVPLGDLKAKSTIAGLAAFLEQPHRTRPAGRMPALLNAKEARDVANYLLQGVSYDMALTKGTTSFAYYEGNWDKLPDFAKEKPKLSGLGPAFDLGVAPNGSSYVLRFDGYFKAESDGTYKFTLESDDGSKMWIDGAVVVDNDGIHPTRGVTRSAKLKKGVHRVVVGFLQVGGGAELRVSVQGPGLGHQDMAPFMAATEAGLEAKQQPKKASGDDDFDIKPELVAKGRELFAAVGCANCHEMKAGGKPIAAKLMAPALARLKPDGGCLSGAAHLPRYGLSLAQQAALAAAIKSPAPHGQEPAEVVKQTLQTFNCYACHTRDKVGGPEDELNRYFKTTQPEMGDEARVPPPLDGVGAKMDPGYLRSLLDRGVHDRPYMSTRMPGFGAANVGALVEAFAALDKLKPAPEVKFDTTPGRVKAAGRYLVGAQALSCIKCHTFAGQKAEGVQGIDMTVMTRRLRRDWFHQYLLDPQRVRPGTRMPASWPDGNTFFPKLLGGKTEAQIEAVWVYLHDGPGAQPPAGLGPKSIPLVPSGSAIIYRNFIQGAGTRAIGVGYPEKVNLAFDANELRLALIWQGAFIDAARHWTDRGVGFEGPLGDNVLKLPAGAPFAVLGEPDAPWPAAAKELGYRFDGYRLAADDRPTFLYSFDGVKVEDFPNASPGEEPGLRRAIRLASGKSAERLHYRAAVADRIEALADGWYRLDGWKLRVTGAAGVIRMSGGRAELLVPVRFDGGKAEIRLEYVW